MGAMKIDRIVRLQKCGIFRDFTWSNELMDFSRFNLIYGWNATGKTTLSRLFHDLELRRAPQTGEATVCIEGRNIDGTDFPHKTFMLKVFNRDFINESVFPVGGGNLPPIFIIGTENSDKQKELEKLKNEISIKESELNQALEAKSRAEEDFDRHCINRAKLIKDTLRSPGYNPYNNYDKSAYKKDADEMVATRNKESHKIDDNEQHKLLVQLRATPKLKIKEINYKLQSVDQLTNSISELLQTSVITETIEALRNDSDLSEWVRHGLYLHKKRQVDYCLFCEQPLPPGRMSALEAHFSAEYEKFFNRLGSKIDYLNNIKKEASTIDLPNLAEFYENFATEYSDAHHSVHNTIRQFIEYIDTLINKLNEKRIRVFDCIELTSEAPSINNDTIDRLNDIIRKHNKTCDEFENRVKEARNRIALGIIAENLDEFIHLKDSIRNLEENLKAVEAEVSRLNEKKKRLEADIIGHRRPASELNEDLKKYLGHNELQLDVQETGYRITRNGQPAYSLSEGEATAIALLYFLKSLTDKNFDLNHGIVVLDDPVSSLDENALYLAFGFIRERTQKAGQLFIFTHNFTFFRQVRNWFQHLKGQNKKNIIQRPARFYMIDCLYDNDQRYAIIRNLDPLLENFESEYHYLFSRIYKAASAITMNLEENYIFPNMARRLLESFLAFRVPSQSGDLWKKMENIEFDEARKLRILRFVHTYSHGDAVGEPEHDLSILSEAKAVSKDLLEFIKKQDENHFNEMVKLIEQTENNEDAK